MRRLCFLLVCCAGCSLDEGGLGHAPDTEAGTPDVTADVSSDVAASDAGSDAVEEPGPPLPCSTDSGDCAAAIPSGWTLTAFSPNRTVSCPANFTATDVVAAPVAQQGACTCSCAVASPPSCALGMVTLKYANDNQCGTTYATYNIATEGACVDYGAGTFTLVTHHSYTKLGLTPGTCTTAQVADKTKVGSKGMRTCDPPSACAEDVCTGAVPQGTRSCIMASGDVACPAGPFSDKVAAVGDDTTLACGACSACNVTQAACGNGTVNFWGDANCTVAKGSEAGNGVCNLTGGASGVNHFSYTNPVQNVVCSAGTSTPSVDLTTKRTVCCRP